MAEMISLTLLDRCDACGCAAAKHLAQKEGNADLLFCNHCLNGTRHNKTHLAILIENGWDVVTDMAAVERDNYNPLLADVEYDLV